jgi:serine/threonine-protein kinase
MAAREPKPGDVLANKYRVRRILGKGGMGLVVLATDLALDRQVALKTLLPALAAEEESVARFIREARAAVMLTSEHSVRVYEVGTREDGTPFMAMEMLRGRDLRAILKEVGRVPVHAAVDYVLQAAEGLAEAHALGMVHRDIKPSNLFVTRRADGSHLIKVLDFGLAKAPEQREGKQLTSTSAVFGSPEYMSPEQTKGAKSVDARADIWALGVTLYELVAGVCPFTAPSTPELFIQILQQSPRPPHTLFADIPLDLSTAILRCLEKEREARFSDLVELANALEPFGAPSSHGSARRIELVSYSTGERTAESETDPQTPDLPRVDSQATTETAMSHDSSPRRTRRVLVSSALGALAMAAVGVTAFVMVAPQSMSTTSSANADSTNASVPAIEKSGSPSLALTPPALAPVPGAASSGDAASPSGASTRNAPSPRPPRRAPARPSPATSPPRSAPDPGATP